MSHEVLRVFTRPTKGAMPDEHEAIDLTEERGVVGDYDQGVKRPVTILLQEDWREAEAELGQEVDPAARRANVLISGAGGAGLIGKRLRIGATLLDVQGEVKPCGLMDRSAAGLKDALGPNCRAGVWARIVEGGTVRPGDPVEVLPAG